MLVCPIDGTEIVDTAERGSFTEKNMFAAIDAHAAFIRHSVALNPHGPGPVAFERGVQYLKSQIPKLRNRLATIMNE